jgi:glucose-6-phosphate isomerase
VVEALKGSPDQAVTAEQLAEKIGAADQTEIVFKILEHLAANKNGGVKKKAKTPWFASTYKAV